MKEYTYKESLLLLNDSKWEKLDSENRTAVLQSVENEMARLAGRDSCTVRAELIAPHAKNVEIIGIFSGEEPYAITVNKDLLEAGGEKAPNFIEFVEAVIHGGRHAYQLLAAEGKVQHSSAEEVFEWSFEFSSKKIDDRQNPRAFYHQSTETDARAYTANMLSKVIRDIFNDKNITDIESLSFRDAMNQIAGKGKVMNLSRTPLKKKDPDKGDER